MKRNIVFLRYPVNNILLSLPLQIFLALYSKEMQMAFINCFKVMNVVN